jgi:hypothetical protein
MFALKSRFPLFSVLGVAIAGGAAVRLMAIASYSGPATGIKGKSGCGLLAPQLRLRSLIFHLQLHKAA